jgi:hypothetical protein
MAQRTTIAPATTEENNDEPAVSTCCHHWVIQPADGPVSIGLCQVCGETREFKNYVESATWGDSRITNKASSSSSMESTSDDADVSAPQPANEKEAASEEIEA